ncbi:Inosose isomerase [Aquisphaera giovannonii]|uniref:Inosose isomerase n=1 Tax=Aquisphaera giovannonii TaxID=406548 RepID=A0A5B9VZL2_9BACT|nr:sugar phosphate isomerase/epimerase family protein [Aquisphaera giovannonii]QEH33792.1 Inosose isomerase [Aquisphaera giovannonii]
MTPPEPFPSAPISRRAALAGGLAAGACTMGPTLRAAAGNSAAQSPKAESPFVIGLNTSTIRGQKLGIVKEIEIAAEAGFQGMEPWMDELKRYESEGGSLADLGKRFRDAGIRVESAIDFFEWVVDDDARRRKGLEDARRSMDILRKVGGTRIASPPSGATDAALPPLKVAERYRALLEIGDQFGVVPQAEVWGFSKTLSRLGEAAEVAIEAGHPKACILPDVFHLFKGGSSLAGIRLLSPESIHVFHVNDYPASPPRQKLNDGDRIFPGDGVAPYGTLLRDLRAGGFRVMLSLELFNRELWKQDPHVVARTGVQKLKELIRASES